MRMVSKEKFIQRFEKRPLSYSQKNTFQFDEREWYDRYILGIVQPANTLMEFGSLIGDSIGTDDSLVPELDPPGVKEYEMRASVQGINLIGFADHYCENTLWLEENKTSVNAARWDQQKVHDHEQLTFYALLLFLSKKVKPEELRIRLNFIKARYAGTQVKRTDEAPLTFETKRTTRQVLEYAVEITKTVDDMYQYYLTQQ